MTFTFYSDLSGSLGATRVRHALRKAHITRGVFLNRIYMLNNILNVNEKLFARCCYYIFRNSAENCFSTSRRGARELRNAALSLKITRKFRNVKSIHALTADDRCLFSQFSKDFLSSEPINTANICSISTLSTLRHFGI